METSSGKYARQYRMLTLPSSRKLEMFLVTVSNLHFLFSVKQLSFPLLYLKSDFKVLV